MLQDLTKVNQYKGKGIKDFTEKKPTTNYQLDTKLIDSDNFGSFTVSSNKMKVGFDIDVFSFQPFLHKLFRALSESKLCSLYILTDIKINQEELDELELTLETNNLTLFQNKDIKSTCDELNINLFYSTNINLISELNKEEKTSGILINYQKAE